MDNELEALKFIYSNFRENVWKALSLGLIALGWILTSDQARDFISKNNFVRIIIASVFLMSGLISVTANLTLYSRSQKIMGDLKQKYKSESTQSIPNVYLAYKLSKRVYFFNSIIILIIFISSSLISIFAI